MGGKIKQSQRTKNNVRPSSSGRSAELLSGANGAPLAGPLGKPLALFPTLAASPLVDTGLTTEFALCFKKLNKKDPVTRTKALQELSELIHKSNVEDVVAALPSWAHVYKMLTVDVDRRVREATQVCHGHFLGAVGRRAAPHLKQLLPAWLQAQYDDHAPAAARAHATLSTTFPESKLPEVLSFCKVEVVTHLLDNLLGNVEAVINKKTEDPEEREQQYIRVVTSSLQGLEVFAARLPDAQRGWLTEQLASLLANNAFWKRASHQNEQLRAAWFALLGTLGARLGAAFAAHGPRALRLLLQRESAPYAAHHQWAALLSIMHAHPEWHQWMDKNDLLVKRVFDILENGGWGEAKRLTAVLLPVLAHLPAELLTRQFYESFFNATFIGLEKKSVLSSKSERQAWITSLSECLRYLSIQQNDFVVELVTSVHRTWLEKVLNAQHDSQLRANLVKHSAASMAALVRYWLKQAKEAHNEKYNQLVRNFWQNIGSTLSTQIGKLSTDHVEIARLVEGHILLVQTLKTGFLQDAKRQQSIKFDGDASEPAERPAALPQCDAASVELYRHNLGTVVEQLCADYFAHASSERVASVVLTPLVALLVAFDTKGLFVAIASQFHADTVYGLYDKVLRTWLAGDAMRCKAVVDVVFLAVKHLNEEEQDAVFHSFQQFPPGVVEWCVAECASAAAWTLRAARRWLRGRTARCALEALARRVVDSGDERARGLLLVCLSSDAHGEMLLGGDAAAAVVSVFAEALRPSAAWLEPCAGVAARLAEALAEAPPRGYDELIAALFRLTLLLPRGDGRLSVDAWCEVQSSWQDGLAAMADAERRAFLAAAVASVHERLDLGVDDLNTKEMEHVASVCPHLLSHCDAAEPPHDAEEAASLSRSILREARRVRLGVEAAALRLDCLVGQLNCPFDDDNDAIARVVRESEQIDVAELTKDDFVAFANAALFRGIYLRALLLRPAGGAGGGADGDDDCGGGGGSGQATWCAALLAHPYFAEQFAALVHDYALVCSLHDGYAFWPHYEMIQQTKQKLDTLLNDVIAETPGDTRRDITGRLSAAAAATGYYWALARRYYEMKTTEGEHSIVLEELDTLTSSLLKLEEVLTGNGYFHSLQANAKGSTDAEATFRSRFVVMLRAWHAAHAGSPVVDDAFAADAARCLRAADIDVVVNAYYRHNDTMLYERDVSTASWRQVVSVAAVADCLAALIDARGWDAEAHHWDFITITLCSLTTSLERSKHAWGCTKVALLWRAVLGLYCGVARFAGAATVLCEVRQPRAHVAALPTEWADVFAPDLAVNIFALALHVLGCSDGAATACRVQALRALQRALQLLSWEHLPPPHRLRAFALSRLVAACAAALSAAGHHAYKYLAYDLLRLLVKPLVLEDAEKLAAWSAAPAAAEDAARAPPTFALAYFEPAWTSALELLDAAVEHLVVGEETCEMAPWSDSHGVALGGLLLSTALLGTCALQRRDLMQHYIQMFRDERYAELLVTACLRLLPADVAVHALDSTGKTAPPAAHRDFADDASLSLDEARPGVVGRLACRALFLCLAGPLGGAARAWWGAAPPRASRALERIAQAYVAPVLVRKQLQHVKDHAKDLEDAEVTVHWSSHEVECRFAVEERHVEVRVALGAAHPLTLPSITAPPAGPGAPTPGTAWLAVYLAYQNGSLLHALRMWMTAVHARIDASPQCYVCYCRLHPSTGRLPRVPCRQCRNKFHHECLRKWFTTSSKSNCPLCRAAF